MKSYEVRNEIERKIRWLGYEKGVYENFLQNAIRDLANVKEYHKKLELAGEEEIKKQQENVDHFDLLLAQEKANLEQFTVQKSKDLPKAAEEPNGKLMCDICGKMFTPQGYPKHRGSCEERQEKLKELARLEELRRELEEENGGE